MGVVGFLDGEGFRARGEGGEWYEMGFCGLGGGDEEVPF